eukprot:6204548-Pleurochrysis_carterae.AAC.6
MACSGLVKQQQDARVMSGGALRGRVGVAPCEACVLSSRWRENLFVRCESRTKTSIRNCGASPPSRPGPLPLKPACAQPSHSEGER